MQMREKDMCVPRRYAVRVCHYPVCEQATRHARAFSAARRPFLPRRCFAAPMSSFSYTRLTFTRVLDHALQQKAQKMRKE